MAMGGDGPWAVSVMWVLTAMSFVFVLLRLYARAVVVQSFGVDDHVYNLAFLLLLCFTIFTTVAAHYGFGQNMSDVRDIDLLGRAILFEAIGETFAVVGTAVAKWSLGLFLLRFVTKTWHKVAIWITMGALMGGSISVLFVFWLQCTPPAYMYNRRISGGYCHVDTIPACFTLAILCVVADFFFAIFPWIFLWSLQMNRREKILIASSLSLGLIAGACGIKRTVDVPSLASENILNSVGVVVWSATEIAVTLICIGIPVCRPLFKRWAVTLATRLSRSSVFGAKGTGTGGSNSHGNNSKKRNGSGAAAMGPPVYVLRTFGGGTMPGAEGWVHHDGVGMKRPGMEEGSSGSQSGDGASEKGVKDHDGGGLLRELRLGMNGPFNEARAVGGNQWDENGNGNEEEILGSAGGFKAREGRGSWAFGKRESALGLELGRSCGRGKTNSIQVTEEWRVDRSGP